jgi:hypothetical protein
MTRTTAELGRTSLFFWSEAIEGSGFEASALMLRAIGRVEHHLCFFSPLQASYFSPGLVFLDLLPLPKPSTENDPNFKPTWTLLCDLTRVLRLLSPLD